jgi:hypothetical protein
VLPPIDVSWNDPTSGRTIELLALQGLGSHRFEPIDCDGLGAAFVVDLTWMHGLPVRAGLDRYGACAYFSAEGNLLRIAPSIALGPLTATGQLIDVLAQFMFTVTGMHSQVGSVVGYLVDPSFMGSKIRADVQGSDVQSTVQLLNLAALTGLQAV